MKIVALLHMFPPIHQAGSETTVHAAFRAMVERGHEVTVLCDKLTPERIAKAALRNTPSFTAHDDWYEFEGVKVVAVSQIGSQFRRIRELAKDADLLATHLDCTSQAMQLGLDLQKPLVHWIHNHAQLKYWHVNPVKCQLAVFNSHWIAEYEQWEGPQIILHPVVEPEKYKCERGTKITFCNPTEGKGVKTVHQLAEAMPDYEFLIVEGIYGDQVAPPNLTESWERAHPNITHIRNTPDFREVLRQTKILLMPSGYESYGRCAVEAACAGIPSIVHPTQGLWEALDAGEYPALECSYGVEGVKVTAREILDPEQFKGGIVSGAGIFCLRDDIDSWKSQIERLYSDEIYYRSRVDAALKLADSLAPEADFDRLEEALLITTQDWRKKEEDKMNRMWTSDRRLYKRSDGSVTENANEAQSLYIGVGGEIPEEEAIKLGLMSRPAETTEVLLDTKAINAPPENKAVTMPETKEKKTRTKKTA